MGSPPCSTFQSPPSSCQVADTLAGRGLDRRAEEYRNRGTEKQQGREEEHRSRNVTRQMSREAEKSKDRGAEKQQNREAEEQRSIRG